MTGDDDDDVVSNITTVTPSIGESDEEVWNLVDDDDRKQDARGHQGDDLISSVRQDDDRQGAVSSGEGDKVVSHITTAMPSMGEKRGSNTGKDKTFHNDDITCTEVPDNPRASKSMVIDDDQSQLPADTVEDTEGQAVPVKEMSSDPSTSPRDPPATQQGVSVHSKGGVCSIHGPGAKLRWRFGGKETERTKEGQLKTTAKRVYFYVCGPRPKGGDEKKKLKQSRLSSFIKTKKTTAENNEDTNNREVGIPDILTPTEGKI